MAKGEAVISIDADLQDDIGVIETMVDRFTEGYEVVYGVRTNRDSDTLFKRFTAEFYYKTLRALGAEIIVNHADFRLLSRRALDALNKYSEVNLFLRGIVPTLGFKTCEVSYHRQERTTGESKYTLKKMLELSIDGVTSFSVVPLRLIFAIGFMVFLASALMSAWALWIGLFTDRSVPGWASSVIPMYLLGGTQLLSLGIVGEYMAKLYLETKRRPRFIIEEFL